ncbi:ribosome biogenesis GTPase YlqF [Lacticigenium naphthae]|uniref:ribosome biogenesis GTPase YlqF n=1 Tax=Lacticigenium naphthae TaxID=515351 RepID=UPI0003F6C724|nr:ribosome biogenesis GTPase YlqF [Lacticigenium naphthae]
MSIQWYPGHMAKARREFQEKLKLVDIVFELLDARIPYSSRNPDLDKLINQKPRVVILTKRDLADPKVTAQWIRHYEKQGVAAIAIDAQEGKGIKDVIILAKKVLEPKMAKIRAKGMKPRAIRAVAVGIPNVGKSTLLNRFAHKNIARTGNKPGVTKAQQWIKYGKELELLDTPGILWPKFEDEVVGKNLALTGAIKDTLLRLDDIALYGMEMLVQHYPGAISRRYDFDQAEETELSLPDLLIKISDKRGFLGNHERAAEMFLFELRRGTLGRFSFDFVDDELDADD